MTEITTKDIVVMIADFGNVAFESLDALGTSREISIAKIKIEEAIMWALKHVSNNIEKP